METDEVLDLEKRMELRERKIDHWEPVSEFRKGALIRVGKLWEYYRDGKVFAKPPVWDDGNE